MLLSRQPGVQRDAQIARNWYPHTLPCLLLNHCNLAPEILAADHRRDIATALAGVEENLKQHPFQSPVIPALPISGDLDLFPRSIPFAGLELLRPPSWIDPMRRQTKR